MTLFASQVTELLPRNRASVIYPEFFRAPCVKKLCVGSLDQKLLATSRIVSTSSTSVQSFEENEQRAPAVGAIIIINYCNMWCLFCICLSRSVTALTKI